MSNRYLTKIAGLNIMDNVIKPVGSLIGNVAKDVGNSFHQALGGGYRDAAVAAGVKNQNALRNAGDVKGMTRAIYEHGTNKNLPINYRRSGSL